jgi:hypothetical protein
MCQYLAPTASVASLKLRSRSTFVPGAMLDRRHDLAPCRAIGTKLVGDDALRRPTLPQQAPGCLGVSPRLNDLIEHITVLVGGAPLNEEFGKAVGADAYCRDAAVAVETAKDFMKRKHNIRVST